MSIICEIDKILTENRDYFISKQRENQENYNYIKEKGQSESDKFPMYAKNKDLEFEE